MSPVTEICYRFEKQQETYKHQIILYKHHWLFLFFSSNFSLFAMIRSVARAIEYNKTQRSELHNHLRPDQNKEHIYVNCSSTFEKGQLQVS